MKALSKWSILALLAATTFTGGQAEAKECLRCMKIEQERAAKGPQKDQYFEDFLISEVSSSDSSSSSTGQSTTSSAPSTMNTGMGTSGSTLNTGVNSEMGTSSSDFNTPSANDDLDVNQNLDIDTDVDTPTGSNMGDTSHTSTTGAQQSEMNNTNRMNTGAAFGSDVHRTSTFDSDVNRSSTFDSNVNRTSTFGTDIDRNSTHIQVVPDRRVHVDSNVNQANVKTVDRTNVIHTERVVPVERSFSTVFVILQTKDFLNTLNGPFTLFIPSNNALRQLPHGTLHELLRPENQDKLSNLVGNHLVANKIVSSDINQSMRVKTVSGKDLDIRVNNGVVTVNGAQVLRSENVGDNGVIYIIDTVLMH
jgi:uncharacterized surface protein with fasciclin (FAS1) repeats